MRLDRCLETDEHRIGIGDQGVGGPGGLVRLAAFDRFQEIEMAGDGLRQALVMADMAEEQVASRAPRPKPS